MGFEIIDGYAGKAHITQDQIGDCNAGTYGSENYVLPVGRKLAYEIITNNKIRVYDGSFLIQGRRCHLQSNTYVDFVVENGSQGEKRYDILAAKYVKDAVTKVETIESVTYKGIPSSGTPDDPSVDSGDIRAGESPIAFPLYRVVIDGINITSVEPLFETLVKMSDINGFLSSYAEIMACTKTGFLPDVLAVKDGFEQLNTKLSTSSGTITWMSNISNNARSANCKKYGNVVVLNFTFNTLAAIAAGTPFITLPSGYRPSDNVYFVAKQAGSQTNEVNATINTKGEVSSTNLQLTANAYYVGQAAFII